MTQSIVSPDDQKVTWVELFFDLVFVFCVTQLVSLLHDGVTGQAVAQVVLLFWLVWWAWTQFTWALNAADTTHHWVELGTLAATTVAFFMAVTLPMAFGRGALPFAVAYVVVRGIGLALYVWVAWTDRAQRAAVMRFTTASVAGLAAVIVGAFAEDTLRYALWGVAIILDIVAAMVGADVSGWNLHPEHFAERHGLFTIIALGETLVVAASGATRADWSGDLIASALLAVAVTSGFWWIYFARAKPLLDAVLESATDIDRSRLGRDVFSLLHFPVVCGVVACAAVVEAAISHPHHPLTVEQRGMLAIGLVLYAGGMAVAARRAGVSGFGPRLLVVATTAIVVVVIGGVLPAVSLGVVFGGTLIVAVVEHIRLPAPHVASRFETN